MFIWLSYKSYLPPNEQEKREILVNISIIKSIAIIKRSAAIVHSKDKLITNIEDQNAFEKTSLDFLKAIKLLKSIEDDNDHNIDDGNTSLNISILQVRPSDGGARGGDWPSADRDEGAQAAENSHHHQKVLSFRKDVW